MKKLNVLLEVLNGYNLPKGDYAIFGSSPLVVVGMIDDVNDLDVIIRPSKWPFQTEGEYLTEDIEFFDNWPNEDVDDLFTATNTADLIAEDSELFELLERATSDDDASELKPITCIRFIYSFTVVIYLENYELERSQIVNNDAEFSALLGEVGEGQFVGVSFPITSQLEDGSTFEVNNKDELKAAIDACVIQEQEGIIGECEGLLQSCVWEVQLPAGATDYDTYENAVFDVAEDGTVSTNSAAQGKSDGVLYWRIPENANPTYVYQCQSHAPMFGTITVKDIANL